MKIITTNSLDDNAIFIRQKVFVEEQGFFDEFDDNDKKATHFIAFDDNGNAVGTCRVFKCDDGYMFGRLAVLKEYRKNKIGSHLMSEVEKFVLKNNGKFIKLHSQIRAVEFYKKVGYTPYGEIEPEEGYPHIWMKKML
ncbi:MAG: GNAT family N-acetyltransferase [Acutalibacteraceae bacterium]|nr:GNAT family N-acetyltransferase [Acutalibacteraceae bacterium]